MERIRWKPKLNSVLSMAMVVCLFFIAGLFFDFYYDLNDDVLLKDIVSGAYSGSPDPHSIQMLYPVSFLISLLYRIFPTLPWQGLFLCGCHGFCFYLIVKRSLSFVEKTWGKIILLLIEGTLILTLFLWELLIVQYTVTAALMAACACFLVFTSERKEDTCSFLKDQIVSMILVIFAFNIRSEMLLLMSPFIAFTGIVKWSEEKEIFKVETLKKYLGLVGIILAGMAVSLLIDLAAYSASDWKAFRDFFDARTKVYDYTWYPSYEEAEEFYQGIGMTPTQVELIDNYNFGLDEAIDTDKLWSIADYADATGIKEPFTKRIRDALTDYKWRTFHEQDAPYNFFVLVSYGMVAALAFVFKDRTAVWKLPLLVVFRTIPWMYVILAKRVPARISHPLYYIEMVILCAWMFSYYAGYKEEKKKQGMPEHTDVNKNGTFRDKGRSCKLCVVLLFVYALIRLPLAWQNVESEMVRRENVNAVMEAFDAYAKANPNNYYYIDVYSSVVFSEKMFEDVDNTQKNYDILGGWADRSPLQKASTKKYHRDNLSRAELLLQYNFYFVCDKESDTEFLEEFYGGHGWIVSLKEKERVGADEDTLIVYKLEITGNEAE